MHTLILGMTESGKTCLAKMLASQLAQTKQVVIYDPILDPRWGKHPNIQKFDESEGFNCFLRSNRSSYVFLDEAGEFFENGHDLEYSWLGTRSRHWGHSVFFIAQRAMQIPKLIRAQCNHLYLFTSPVTDGKILAEEFNQPTLLECNRLPQLQCYSCSRYSKAQRLVVVPYKEVRKMNVD